MNKYEKLALHLMKKHNLVAEGWTFGFDNAKTRCGVCDFTNKIIKLSKHYVKDPTISWRNVQNTILHEIAHVIAGYEAGHGNTWKRIAASIGCDGSTCNSAWKGALANYKLWCNCRRVNVTRYRLSAKFKSCVCATCKTMHIAKM